MKINIGVVTQNPKADAAAAENASRVAAMLNALYEAIVRDADVKTLSYGLTPDYRNQSGDRQPEITGPHGIRRHHA